MGLREQVLATRNAAAVPPVPVATPEWPDLDGKLFVKVLSAYQVDEVFSEVEQSENERARIVSRTMCDSDGRRVLDNDDELQIGYKESPVVERFYWAARFANGLTVENRDTFRKNLNRAADGGLPSTSAAQPIQDSA